MNRLVTILSFAAIIGLLALGTAIPAEAQPGPMIQLSVRQIEMDGTIHLAWGAPPSTDFVEYYVQRSKAPDPSFIVIDTTKETSFKERLPLPGFNTMASYTYRVVGRRPDGSLLLSNPVTVDLPGVPTFNAFRLEAKVEGQSVHLRWNIPPIPVIAIFPPIKINGFLLFRVSINSSFGTISDSVLVGDSVLLPTDTSFVDTPPLVAGTLNTFAYVVRAVMNNGGFVQSTAAVVTLRAFLDRDTVRFVSSPVTTGNAGSLYRYEAVAKSSDPAATIRYFLERKPAGMTVDSVSGVVTYMPHSRGWYSIRLRAYSSKGGHALQEYELIIGAGNGVIAGRVTDTLDNPIRQVIIEALKRDAQAAFAYSAISDSLGYYRLAHLDPGTYIIHATPMSYEYMDQWYNGKTSAFDATPVQVLDTPSVATANFRLRSRFLPTFPSVIVSGTISDSSGLPIVGNNARVVFVQTEFAFNVRSNMRRLFDFGPIGDFRLDGISKHVFATRSDSFGHFSMKLPIGSYIAFAKATGYAVEFYKERQLLLAADVMRLVADSAGIDFTLDPYPPVILGEISGRVIDSVKDVGVPSRLIAFPHRWGNGPRPEFRHARPYFADSDSLGSYTFTELLPGRYIVLALPLGGYAPAFYSNGTTSMNWKRATPIEINGTSVSGIDIYVRALPDSLQGYTGITGTISLPGGSTIAGAMVFAMSGSGAVANLGFSNAQGRYSIGDLAPGTYTVSVDMPGYTASSDVTASPSYTAGGMPQAATANFTVTAVTTVGGDLPSQQPSGYQLVQNYPNPFNPSTTIEYSLPAASRVTLRVYNLLGQEVATLTNGDQPAGTYAVTFNAGSLASGVYFYRLEAGSFNTVRKMMLIK